MGNSFSKGQTVHSVGSVATQSVLPLLHSAAAVRGWAPITFLTELAAGQRQPTCRLENTGKGGQLENEVVESVLAGHLQETFKTEVNVGMKRCQGWRHEMGSHQPRGGVTGLRSPRGVV